MKLFRASLIGLMLLSFGAFTAQAQPEEKSSAPLKAIAVLHPTGSNKVSGTVTFTEVADGVQVQAEITGLTPGNHGFHVHEFGDCSATDLSSAGGRLRCAHCVWRHRPSKKPVTVRSSAFRRLVCGCECLPRERGTRNVNLFARQGASHLVNLAKTIRLHAYATNIQN